MWRVGNCPIACGPRSTRYCPNPSRVIADAARIANTLLVDPRLDVFRDFAAMSSTELLVIDNDTTLGGFERELRWNAAYYRLARGI